MIPCHDFISSPNSLFSRRWIDLPWRFVSWSLEQIGLQSQELMPNLRTPKQFVLMPNVEVRRAFDAHGRIELNHRQEACSRLMSYLRRRRSQVDRILTREMFRRESASALGVTNELSDSDVAVLLKYLARDRQILAYDDHVRAAYCCMRTTYNPDRLCDLLPLRTSFCPSPRKTAKSLP